MGNPTCCDCGRECVPSGCGTGYAKTAGGSHVCYECCAERDRAEMMAKGAHSGLYLTTKPDGYSSEVTNWPGTLRFPVTYYKRSTHGGGFGAQRTDAWFRGPDGFMWHAINRGDMQIARCKRTRERLA